MATLASTAITTAIAADASQPLAFGDSGLIMEVWKVALGGAGDTVAITPKWITDIRFVQANWTASDTLSQTASNTNVTLTLAVSAATTLTFQVQIVGRR